MTLYCCVCAADAPRKNEAHYLVNGYAVCFNHIRAASGPRYVISTQHEQPTGVGTGIPPERP